MLTYHLQKWFAPLVRIQPQSCECENGWCSPGALLLSLNFLLSAQLPEDQSQTSCWSEVEPTQKKSTRIAWCVYYLQRLGHHRWWQWIGKEVRPRALPQEGYNFLGASCVSTYVHSDIYVRSDIGEYMQLPHCANAWFHTTNHCPQWCFMV